MVMLITGLLFALAVALSTAEAIVEKDWPSHTFRFVLIFGALFAVWFFI